MIRDDIKTALVSAMKAGEKPRVGTIRLIQSSLKNRDIELRGKEAGDDDALVTDVLQKMIKQRRESIDMYKKGGREELADAEAAEIAVIESFLPEQMSEAELGEAIDAIVAETGAASIKDMGRVMAVLKERHAGKVDMGKAGAAVRGRLA
ncbi:MAG TPA: GatB/YqeY domain-containing protein [Allosphingosinicella sp.]|nr:GatB/YqeY domain-containing protein [Allosphingosinicella sp.]